MNKDSSSTPSEQQLQWLLAELTYACPLQCPYCSNPLDYTTQKSSLDTEQWCDAFTQARALGCIQLGFSGGEPLLRKDLEVLVEHAHQLGFYTNLITSAVGMTAKRLNTLAKKGLDSIQISFQAAQAKLNDALAATSCFEHKLQICQEVKKLELPLTLNFVLHRQNIDSIEDMMALSVRLKADFVELANTQYYGFAFLNRHHLLPTKEQLEQAEQKVKRYRKKHPECQFIYVIPDYYERRPKPCLGGWARSFMTITPNGSALPCQYARIIKSLSFPNIVQHKLKWIWEESEAFNAFRGFSWMKTPCRDCPERFKDFGGCRCQAFMLSGDARNADPVCEFSPHNDAVQAALSLAKGQPEAAIPLVYRNPQNAKKIIK